MAIIDGGPEGFIHTSGSLYKTDKKENMSILITILIGFLKFSGMAILMLPFFRLYVVGGSDYDGNNKILKFYLNIFPIIFSGSCL